MSSKRLIIIVEGSSEQEFVTQILRPHFYSKQVYDVSVFQIKHSKGGLSKYSHLKTDILNCIYQPNTIVTTLIDFYGLPSDFPDFHQIENIENKNEKVDFLETAIKKI